MPARIQEVRMSRPRLVLAASVALAALPAALADDQPVPLKFGWPVPSRATVTENVVKKGLKATTRYVVNLAAEGKTTDLRMHISDFEFVEIEGRPATDPALAPQLAQATAIAKMIPDLLITADGKVKDVVGFEAQIEAQLAAFEKSDDPRIRASVPAMRAMWARPEAVAMQKRVSSGIWRSWVGEWVGRAIPEGRSVETKFPLQCPDSVDRDAPTTLRRTPSADGAAMAQFSRESVLDGDDAKPVIEAYLKKLSDATGRVPPEITGMRLSERVVVSVDPATLRPKRAFSESVGTIRLKGQDDRVNVERHEYTFEWLTTTAAAGDK
jgi:hypothetical protein